MISKFRVMSFLHWDKITFSFDLQDDKLLTSKKCCKDGSEDIFLHITTFSCINISGITYISNKEEFSKINIDFPQSILSENYECEFIIPLRKLTNVLITDVSAEVKDMLRNSWDLLNYIKLANVKVTDMKYNELLKFKEIVYLLSSNTKYTIVKNSTFANDEEMAKSYFADLAPILNSIIIDSFHIYSNEVNDFELAKYILSLPNVSKHLKSFEFSTLILSECLEIISLLSELPNITKADIDINSLDIKNDEAIIRAAIHSFYKKVGRDKSMRVFGVNGILN